MNVQQLQDCAAVLGEMSSNFLALPTDKANAVQAGTYCLMAQTYVLELAKHLIEQATAVAADAKSKKVKSATAKAVVSMTAKTAAKMTMKEMEAA